MTADHLNGAPRFVIDDETMRAVNRREAAAAASSGASRVLAIGELFEAFQRNGDGYKALCPAHHDNNPSLSINEGDDGRVLIHCHAGCDPQDVLAAVGLTFADLMPSTRRLGSIVATYDYRDEQGQLLYQSVRYVPKNFKQRRPNGADGWVWSLKGVRRVLYRLPQLRANPTGPVIVVEGEKDADRLASLGALATTNPGGAGPGKWLNEYTEFLRGRHVILLPDNDVVGWDHMQNVARSLHGVAASVRVVGLPGLSSRGDVSDWLDAGGTPAQLLALAEQTPLYGSTVYGSTGASVESVDYGSTGASVGSANRRPVERRPVGLPPFPVGALPRGLQTFVTSIASALPCPVDFPGAMMLPVLSAFIGRKRCVEIKPSWQEHPLLWVAVVAASGDRKTAALNKVAEPLRRKQYQLKIEYMEAVRQHALLPPEQQATLAEPQMHQVLTTDSTIEALKDVLGANTTGIMYLADELSGWARGMSQYKGGRGDDRQHWLSIWSGVQIVCNRKGAPPTVINNPFVSVTGGIQPPALADLIDDGREDGFAARILFAYPNPIPNTDWTEATVSGSEDYARICESLWNLAPSGPVTFSPQAKARWVEWINAHRKESPPIQLRPTWSKAEGYCARLALILFLSRQACGEAAGSQIDEPSIEGAIALINYFKAHARRVYGSMADQKDQGRIGKALKWIRGHGGAVTARQIQQHAVSDVKNAEAAKALLCDLADLGHGTVTEEARGSVVFRLAEPAGSTVYGSTVPPPAEPDIAPDVEDDPIFGGPDHANGTPN
jgi:hypothetical protein